MRNISIADTSNFHYWVYYNSGRFYVILWGMITAPAYMAVRFLQRFIDFFVHWYGGGTRIFWGQTIRLLTRFRRLFKYSSKDGVADFIFWASRVFLGAIAYLAVVVVSFILYISWILLPLYAFFKILDGVFINV